MDLAKFEQIKASGNLPSPKGVALAILRLAQQEDVSVAQLAHAAKSDPAFVGRLLKAANRVNTSPGRPVVSVHEALVVLGVRAVRTLALGFSLLSQFRRGACVNFDYERYWSGSLAFGIATEAITQRTRVAPVEEAFSVGLLARIGELALATLFPSEYSEILGNGANAEYQHLLRAEQRSFAMTHGELTAALLCDWGVPSPFTDAIAHYENPDACPFAAGGRQHALVHTLALARHVARICVAAEAERAALMLELLARGSRVGIEGEALSVLCDGVVRDWLDWSETLDLKAAPLPPFESLKQPPSSLPEGAAGESGEPLRVLVVAGAADLRSRLRAPLECAGYEVHEAADEQDGLRAALEAHPHIVLVDTALAARGGAAMVRALRETDFGRGLYVLLMTEAGTEQQLVQAFHAGADDVAVKTDHDALLVARLRAGHRVVRLQHDLERDRENMRHFAAELAITNRRLQEAALTDPLTGLPNRRYAMERLAREWSASERSGRPLACMVIDLDAFKQVNDTYGHDAGDAYLTQSAQAIRLGLRAHDVVCRTGGDEFLVICAETNEAAAATCAERVRRSVENTRVRVGLLRLRATLSIGVAVRTGDMDSPEALVKCADRRLYSAKQRGRNRVVKE